MRTDCRLLPGIPRQAIALIDVGQPTAAIDELRAALARKPDDPILLGAMGRAYLLSHRFTEAVEFLQRAAQLKTASADLHDNLGAAAGLLSLPRVSRSGPQPNISAISQPPSRM